MNTRGVGREAAWLRAVAVVPTVGCAVPIADNHDSILAFRGSIAQRKWSGVMCPGWHCNIDKLVRPADIVRNCVVYAGVGTTSL